MKTDVRLDIELKMTEVSKDIPLDDIFDAEEVIKHLISENIFTWEELKAIELFMKKKKRLKGDN
ncbi:hypothetical protein SAMN05444487_11856 [Marininema mesophilum]|uniref:Uncharacterized protein n=1 Tax=Marininema mesophilum TaxID=1048340 RepID=A0A1H3BWB4_9BACL|nr:hypothetical protein [Marininema mesophilum]SDX46116.1 hypothetical protein SAMN05444487_11856 [Marininema mesophilum]